MPTIMTPAELDAREDLADWRYVLGRLEATFRCPTFGAAGRLALAIAEAADAADHHPDLDVRYPGVLRVTLTTHAAGAETTDLDVAMAATITDLAASAAATSEPSAAQGYEVGIDALDVEAVVPFWEAVLGYGRLGRADGPINLVDPARVGPAVWFQQMDAPRPQRNRLHLDVTVSPEIAEQRVAAAIAAGGRLVSDEHARSWWVLADAEENEVCVCTWLDR